ncbi:c-type cytochrome biogenesis protein CcmI [Acetobacter sp. TBRC 12305]|uniref:C-type cytochrome biogenesis protein CcmI n=1 Tax=Acetobacter garciniae TaxID=2817435 RepID=A0A939HGB6_9PROT|nr:c-type cytochrome biogenesis protein CcmI [Acetobacter garciniae]MBO1323855.1 c-type cytochrome biogenesis protein CcmI [Acetobacter garciniae]MBX0343544.1 c-type cytochrome biogenesis protein CcmI [Acetobacter garciniae]
MIWLSIALLSLIALAPAAWGLWRRDREIRDERSAALVLHGAQLAEVDRDLAIGLIAPEEHGVAKLEIQRRILAADIPAPGGPAVTTARWGWVMLVLAPFLAVALYLTNGMPFLPAQPLGPRLVARHMQDQKDDAVVAQLRQALATLPETDPNLRQGYLLLGQAEAGREHYAAAADAWGHALALGFEPELAARTAEALTRVDQHVTPQALDLFRKALDAAPKDAPWRDAAQARIAQGEHELANP